MAHVDCNKEKKNNVSAIFSGYSGILRDTLRVFSACRRASEHSAGSTDSLKTCRWSIDGRGGMDNLHLYLCVCVFVCVFLLDKFFPHNKIFASF